MHMPRASGRIAGALTAAGLAVGLLTFAGVAGAQSPLEPVDTSSPRATFESFLALTDESSRRYNAFRENPGPATERAVRQLSDKIVRLFDLTDVAPAARMKTAAETYYLLWDVTARLELPELTEIPDEAAVSRAAETRSPIKRWRIPDTDITIARVEAGEREGEFLFSPDTVARAPSYHEAMLGMPYLRPTAAQNVYGIYQTITGWMIPPAWVEKLPEWTMTVVAGQVLWKWLALLLLSGLAVWAGVAAVRWSVRGEAADDTSSSFMRRLSAPVAIFLLAELLWLLALRQINVTGFGAALPVLLRELASGVAAVWIAWTGAHWIAERIIASPNIPTKSLHANLIRFAARAVGSLAAVVLVFRVAQEVGVPVYGLIAGAGVGGLAIALAVRSTLENVVGTLNIYVDRPIQVGDSCRYGSDMLSAGTIEEIGLRSTRIRGVDRSVTTIPNAEFANMHIVNLGRRDRILMSHTIGLRYETTPDQLRFVLAKLREVLAGHPQVSNDKARVRAKGFGPSALEIDVFAYVLTADRQEFYAIQEDLILRFMQIINEAGTALAFPSSTVYQARDAGLNAERQAAAEKHARESTSANALCEPAQEPLPGPGERRQ